MFQFPSHISSAQSSHVATGYHIGQHTYGAFPLLQKVLLDSADKMSWLECSVEWEIVRIRVRVSQ